MYFRGKNHFEDDGTQNWLVFQPIQNYFKTVSTTDSNILSWKSKGLADKVLSNNTSLINFLILHQILLVPKQE